MSTAEIAVETACLAGKKPPERVGLTVSDRMLLTVSPLCKLTCHHSKAFRDEFRINRRRLPDKAEHFAGRAAEEVERSGARTQTNLGGRCLCLGCGA
jgi:hypothetical protein